MRNDTIAETDIAPLSEQATHWWVLLNGEGATVDDRREFGAWVARSPERIAAYLQTARLMRALKSSDVRWPDTPAAVLIHEAKAAPAEAVSLHPRALEPPKLRAWPSRPFALVAVLLIAMVASWLAFTSPETYRTALGEQRSVVLDDGSLVTLNTSTEIEVDIDERRRTVYLRSGEALFQVAHDRSRPFDVIAGNAAVRAVGTQFNVDRRKTRTTVTVVEGKVAVSPAAAVTARMVTAAPIYLRTAERVVIANAKISSPERVATLAAATAWTQRRLVFERRPLGEVAEEFNRYNRERIVIENLELREQEVTGVFQANDPGSFIEFMSKIPDVRIRRTAEGHSVVTFGQTGERDSTSRQHAKDG